MQRPLALRTGPGCSGLRAVGASRRTSELEMGGGGRSALSLGLPDLAA